MYCDVFALDSLRDNCLPDRLLYIHSVQLKWDGRVTDVVIAQDTSCLILARSKVISSSSLSAYRQQLIIV